MFRIENTLVSEEIIEKYFHCNISACKGACCIEGEAGAPLEKQEADKLENNYNKISEYLSDNANKIIKSKGSYIKLEDGNIETPLLNNKACVYVHYESNGTLSCGVEKAYKEKKINFNKPISCHLYPIRIKEYSEFTAVNYHNWSICSDACSLGAELKKPVFEFVKEALIRKFGSDWYNSLEKISKKLLKNK
ncbi:MAG: DUF3109 family protein [Flavobacteriales bacterium]|jgi:hypothetical protein|tara:strand:+ start:7381 stop:7956 length:576 start_codon:yes stop_codon:yes gene_type:complete